MKTTFRRLALCFSLLATSSIISSDLSESIISSDLSDANDSWASYSSDDEVDSAPSDVRELFDAIANNDTEKVSGLLDANPTLSNSARANKCNPEIITPVLHCAIEQKNIDIVQLLIERQSDIEAKGQLEMTALHYAIQCREISEDGGDALETIINLLIDKNACVNAKDQSGRTPLIQACDVEASSAVIKKLLAANADVNAQSNDGTTALHMAYSDYDTEILPRLVAAGAKINARTQKGKTPLMYAASSLNTNAINFLIAANADPRLVSNDGQMILHYAAKMPGKMCTQEFMQILLDIPGIKEQINHQDYKGYTPYRRAESRNNQAAMQLLLASNADPNIMPLPIITESTPESYDCTDPDSTTASDDSRNSDDDFEDGR